jgi:hypothetical protein
VNAAIAAIAEDVWTTIAYNDANFDESSGMVDLRHRGRRGFIILHVPHHLYLEAGPDLTVRPSLRTTGHLNHLTNPAHRT